VAAVAPLEAAKGVKFFPTPDLLPSLRGRSNSVTLGGYVDLKTGKKVDVYSDPKYR
jgi:hypothetical protein